MILPEFLTHVDGEVRLTGHRINFYSVVRLHSEGNTAEQIAEEFDLEPPLVNKVLAFYQENRAEADAYANAYGDELKRQEALYSGGPVADRMRRLRELLRQADERFGAEPGWAGVPIAEKLRRIEEATPPPTV